MEVAGLFGWCLWFSLVGVYSSLMSVSRCLCFSYAFATRDYFGLGIYFIPTPAASGSLLYIAIYRSIRTLEIQVTIMLSIHSQRLNNGSLGSRTG